MILSGPEIKRRMFLGHLNITPWNESRLNPNSYNLTLGDILACYVFEGLRTDAGNLIRTFPIPREGCWLEPRRLYLGHTVERTVCKGLVPILEGRSSLGRLGLSVHATAGFGDDGFDGQWTLELSVVQPLLIHAGLQVCQIAFLEMTGERMPYAGRYQGQAGPTASRIHLDANNATA